MKPPSFDYEAPTSLDQAVALLAANEFDAKLLAGGQSLMPLLNMRLTRPALLIDLARIPGLGTISEERGVIAIGAMARQREVELSPLVRDRHPLLRAALLHVAHPQNRNQGTIGGSLAHADPAAELPALAVALDAELEATGPDGKRTIPAADFFLTYLTTSLAGSEILTAVRYPALPAKTGWSFIEVARRHGDFALTGAIAVITLDTAGRIGSARVVLFAVDSKPRRASAAETLLVGEAPSSALFERAATAASGAIEEPLSDVHATAEFRKSLAVTLTRRALAEATEKARAA
jgi:CO/xanthine dehydrogenase FAD-binding subunit